LFAEIFDELNRLVVLRSSSLLFLNERKLTIFKTGHPRFISTVHNLKRDFTDISAYERT